MPITKERLKTVTEIADRSQSRIVELKSFTTKIQPELEIISTYLDHMDQSNKAEAFRRMYSLMLFLIEEIDQRQPNRDEVKAIIEEKVGLEINFYRNEKARLYQAKARMKGKAKTLELIQEQIDEITRQERENSNSVSASASTSNPNPNLDPNLDPASNPASNPSQINPAFDIAMSTLRRLREERLEREKQSQEQIPASIPNLS